ncbi:peroxiredoxin [Aurantimonas marianensis]|uniref:Peroxiredoxin n=1 Tax=Aurantimonas marianensis TaxID=2920428 RepID=A0A9X2HBW5_9HYPH|nr:peroxiredoxin [Aurantimonas marianensis]MCP3054799.1 peroxiredoxin [Aurantimonas marianensis]
MTELARLPDDLTSPADDGAADHLAGLALPSVPLEATDGRTIDLSAISGRLVLYVYPMTGKPGIDLPEGWNETPGARGCTPQSCAFRDHFAELGALGVDAVFGLSSQSTADQREAAERLHLPFALLSDEHGAFRDALRLPAFELGGRVYLKRTTLIIDDGRIAKVFYPVFPPDRNAADVIAYLAAGR